MKGQIKWESTGRFTGAVRISEWEINPERSALVLLDLQRHYIESSSRLGTDGLGGHPEMRERYLRSIHNQVLPNCLLLQRFFRAHGLQIIYTRTGFQLPGGADLPEWSWRRSLATPYFCDRGTPEYEIVPAVTVADTELILDKNTYSPFSSTPIDQILRNLGVENVIVAGGHAMTSVEATALDAGDRGYNAIALTDACATYHPIDYEVFTDPHWWIARTTAELLEQLTELLD